MLEDALRAFERGQRSCLQELWHGLQNLDGGNLEQVTTIGGFTSFPEPDGTKLAFTSSYQAKERYEFNIFVADWK